MLLCQFCCRVDWMELPSSAAIFTGFDVFFLRGAGIEAGIHVKNAGATNAGVATLVWGKFLGKNMLQKTFLASPQCWPSGLRCLSGRSFGSYLQGRRVTSSARCGLAGHASRFARATVGAVKRWRPDGNSSLSAGAQMDNSSFELFHVGHVCVTCLIFQVAALKYKENAFCVAGAICHFAWQARHFVTPHCQLCDSKSEGTI